MRLGIYSDLVYREDENGLSTHQAFIRFVTGLPPRIDEVVLFGRVHPERGRSHYALPDEGVRFVRLPYYESIRAIATQARVVSRSRRTFAAELARLDGVWIFGPHPMALAFAALARRRRVPLALGVRQDYPTYIESRLPGRRWAWAVPAAHALERAFRRLAAAAPTVALGSEIARTYAAAGGPVLTTGFSLVRADEFVTLDHALAKSWDGPLRILSVGRLDVEKNPLLLVDVLAGLRERDPRWRLTLVGEGPLAPALASRAAERGVAEALDLRGYVPSGPDLWALYRDSHAFLHVSLTEGLPQVLWEAQASGLPVVATAVGGVPEATGGGASAILVPPRDVVAPREALRRLAADPAERRRLVEAGMANASRETMEAHLDRIAGFLREELGRAR